MRRLERGASYVPLIIVVVLLIVAVVWAYTSYDEANKLEQDLKDEKAKNADLTQQNAEAAAYLTQLKNALGWPIEADDPGNNKYMRFGSDVDLINQFKSQTLGDLRNTYVREFPENAYTVDPNGGIRVGQSGDKLKIVYVSGGEIPAQTNIERLYGTMNTAMGRMLLDIGRLVRTIERKQSEYATREAALTEQLTQKDGVINDLRDQYQTLQSNASSAERDLRDQINTLQDQVRAAEDKADEADKESREVQTTLRTEIAALKQDVIKLKQRQRIQQEPIGPDGQILSVTADQGLAVINRGKAQHLQTGTTFNVYSYGKGAQKIMKGAIIVLDVDDEVARCRVVELKNPMNPITSGDEIESLTYNPAEKLNFVLIGRFRKYGRSDAMRRLQDLGLGVDDTVSIDTDYLVLGAPEQEEENLRDSDNYKRAQELGVMIITEDQLSRFLMY